MVTCRYILFKNLKSMVLMLHFRILRVLIWLLVTINVQAQQSEKKPLITIGKFEKIFDQSIGENDTWYINDHCLFRRVTANGI